MIYTLHPTIFNYFTFMKDEDRIDDLEDTVKSIVTWMNLEWGYRPTTETPETDGNMGGKLKKAYDAIFGNGKMGLKTKLTLIMWGHVPFSMAMGALIKEFAEKIFN